MADRSITVRLRAEVNDFKREMAQGAKALDDLVKKSGDAAGAANTTMGRIAQSVRHQSDAWSTVSRNAGAAGAATLGVGAMVAKTGIAYNTLQQTSRAALGTILGGAQKANAQMEQLDAFARTSPFSKQVFIQAQQQMLAFGIESQKVIPYLSAINDAVAASGGNSQMLGEVAFVIAQIGAAGKITATDLMQLGQRGINAAELIGSKMGMTGAEVRASITKGSLDAGEALDALAAGMSERFAGASAAVKDTMGGALDRVSAAWRDLASTIMSTAVDPTGGGWLVDLTNTLADIIRFAGKVPEPALQASSALAGLAGAGAIGVAAVTALVPRYIEYTEAAAKLAEVSPRASKAIAGLGKAAGLAGLALGAMVVSEGLLRSLDGAAKSSEELARSLELVAAQKTSLGDLFTGSDGKGVGASIPLLRDGVYDLQSAMKALNDEAGGVSRWSVMWSLMSPVANLGLIGEALGIISTDSDKARDAFAGISQELTKMPADQAATAFAEVSAQMADQGANAQQIIDLMPTYANQVRDALRAANFGSLAEDAEVVAAAMAGDLPEGLALTEQGIMSVSDAAKLAAENVGAIPGAYASWSAAALMGAESSKEAMEAYQKYLQELGQGSPAFISAEGALSDLRAAHRKTAEETAAATKSTKDSWEDYYDGVSFRLGDYLKELEAQAEAQANWQSNMVALAGKVSSETLAELSRMGPEGAPLVAQLVNASESELKRLDAAFAAGGASATGEFAEQLANAEAVWPALLKSAGQKAVDKAKAELAAGKTTLERIVSDYDLEMLIRANTDPAIAAALAAKARIDRMTATVKVGTSGSIGKYHAAGLNAPAATGGYGADLAAAYLAGGGQARRRYTGLLNGPGTPTSDSIPAWLSTKEFVQNAAAVDYYGPDVMYALNARSIPKDLFEALGFAAGGSAGTKGNGVSAPSSALTQMLAKLQIGAYPVSEIANFGAALTKATTAAGKKATADAAAAKAASAQEKVLGLAEKRLAKREGELASAKTGSKAYQRAEADLKVAQKAVDPRSALGKNRTKLRNLKRKSTSGLSKSQKEQRKKDIDALQKKIDRAEDKRNLKIAEARDKLDWEAEKRDKKVAVAEKNLALAKKVEAAQVAENTRLQEKAKKAADKKAKADDKAKKAADDLAAAHQRLADGARQISEQYASNYMSGGDLADTLANMKEGAELGTAFAAKIEKLRALGLSEDVIQQAVIGQGEVWGADLADEIIKGGKPAASSLNAAAASLDKAADKLGLAQAIGVQSRAGGGRVYGPGTATSDSVWMRASAGEYVVKTASAQAIGYETLDYANATGRLPDGVTVTPASQTITYVTNIHQVELPGVKTLHEMDGVAREMALKIHRSGARRG